MSDDQVPRFVKSKFNFAKPHTVTLTQSALQWHFQLMTNCQPQAIAGCAFKRERERERGRGGGGLSNLKLFLGSRTALAGSSHVIRSAYVYTYSFTL